MKVQVDADGVTVISDGYLVSAPAWRAEHGVVYELNGTDRAGPAAGRAARSVLQQCGRETRAETRRRFAEGEPIPKGDREHRDLLARRRPAP